MPFPFNKTLAVNPFATKMTAVSDLLAGDLSLAAVRGIEGDTKREYYASGPRRGPAGFERFCDRFCILYDQKSRVEVPMDLFDGQREVVPDLVRGTWLVLLKGRQLGLTWLLVAYVLWCICYRKHFTCIIINQQRDYAEDFIARVLAMYDRLPVWMQKECTSRNKQSLEFKSGGNNMLIRAVVGGHKAGRSMTIDLAILDEASRIPDLDDTMAAVQPGVESAGGQIVALSSSAGPQGYFYESWKGAYGDDGELLTEDGKGPNGFKPIFLHWSKRRGRDQAWYEQEKRRLGAISPVRIKQEHPENAQEAWEYASGRIYALFRRDPNVGEIADLPLNAVRYRAIDWGSAESPFVCLWLVHVPGPPALLVSEKCPETIREFFAYRWDEKIESDKEQKPLKRDDHTCDAVRYAVTTFNLTGLVWVYREFYEVDSVEKGWNIMNEIHRIHRMSGWEEAPDDVRAVWWPGDFGEIYEGTVADRSWSKAIVTYSANDIPCRGHKVISRKQDGKELTDRGLTETLEGIRQVAALIDGSKDVDKIVSVTRERLAMSVLAQTRKSATSGLEDRSLASYARRLLASQRRKDRGF